MKEKIRQLWTWSRSHPKTTVIVVIFILGLMGSLSTPPTPPTSPNTEQRTEQKKVSTEATPQRPVTWATDRLTCERFGKFYQDIKAEILTDVEAREQIKGVYDKSRYANPDLNKASTELLSAFTKNEAEGVNVSFETMISLCNEILK